MRRDHGGMTHLLDGTPVLDFSASINPLGLPTTVERILLDAIPALVHYPDPGATSLREALARLHHVPAEQVLVGNGSTGLIYLSARALRPRAAVVVHPAFSEYEAALDLVGCRISHFVTVEENHFLPDLDRVNDAVPDAGLVILANPANPTGALLPPVAIDAIAEQCLVRGTALLVDEAFIDLTASASVADRLARFPNLLVLRSLTKFFALPGLRIGYALGSTDLIATCCFWEEPWSVNSMAQAAGLAAIADQEYAERSRRLIPLWREDLAARLAMLGPLKVFRSAGNYLLVKILSPHLTAPMLHARLLESRIAVRDCSSFQGLSDKFVRVAVRNPAENERLLSGLSVALEGA